MRFSFYGKTDIGKVRKKNEDCFLAEKLSQEEFLFAVADGMGGHMAGEIASSMACRIIKEKFEGKDIENPASSLLEAFEEANLKIFEEGQKLPSTTGMGTTLTVLYIKGNYAYIGHIGDSRVYILKDDKLMKLTKDHSLVEKLLMEGSINPQEARKHPKRNILYESIGVLRDIHPQLVGPLPIKGDEIFILCSDGLTLHLDEEEIMNIALSCSPEEGVEKMISIANERGGKDNITVILIKGRESNNRKRRNPKEKEKSIDYLSLILVLIIYIFFLAGGYLIQKRAEKMVFSHANKVVQKK